MSVAYITEKDVAKLVDALSAEQMKCRKLIEALRPFATDAPRLVYRIAALRPDCEAAIALLKALGELEEK